MAFGKNWSGELLFKPLDEEQFATSLAAGIVGAFQDRPLKELLHLPQQHEPLLIMPVGYSH